VSSRLVSGLPHRLLSAALASGPFVVDTCVSYASDRNPWRILCIMGWFLVGSAWFLRPAVLSRDMLSSNHRSAALAVISQKQWAALVGVGLLVVAVALVGRYTNAS